MRRLNGAHDNVQAMKLES